MGIPYYFSYLIHKYKNISKASDFQNTTSGDKILYIDFNGVLHTCAQEIIKSIEKRNDVVSKDEIEEMIYERIWAKTLEIIEKICPRETIICVDGVAPFAKIIQQRKRRYLSSYEKRINGITCVWDTNAITPGTMFMKNLNLKMKEKIKNVGINIIYHGSDEVGEGEHKIFEHLQKTKRDSDDKIIIHGLDADLIILSLISHLNGIFLMREQNTSSSSTNTFFLEIDNLKLAILEELMDNSLYSNKQGDGAWKLGLIYRELPEDNFQQEIGNLTIEEHIIENYCILCSLLGNDFIPQTFTFKHKHIDSLIKACNDIFIEKGNMILSKGEICRDVLSDIFKHLAEIEDSNMLEFVKDAHDKQYVKRSDFENESDYYAIKHKSPVLTEILKKPEKWRSIYTSRMFYGDNLVIAEASKLYISGIYWVYNYYKKQKPIDHSWYYPFYMPPCMRDIYNNSVGHTYIYSCNDDINHGLFDRFIPPEIQLMLVLPIQSKELFPMTVLNVIENDDSVFHMYPKDFQISTFLKTHLWECAPILPTIDTRLFEFIYREYFQ
jgi:5'-3' exonuclease